jgi:hypothetical protein
MTDLFTETFFPAELDTPAFRQAWAEWLEYRKERRLPKYTGIGLKKQFARLSGWGVEASVAAIDLAIAQNWQGIQEPRAVSVPPARQSPVKAKESAWSLKQRLEAIDTQLNGLKQQDGMTVYLSGDEVPAGEYPGRRWTDLGKRTLAKLKADRDAIRAQLGAVSED